MDDSEALIILHNAGYSIAWGMITGPLPKMESQEAAAIDELCDEWDYMFEVTNAG